MWWKLAPSPPFQGTRGALVVAGIQGSRAHAGALAQRLSHKRVSVQSVQVAPRAHGVSVVTSAVDTSGDRGCSVFRNTLCCCYCSAVKSCPTPCNLMHCSTPGSSALHYLLSFLKLTSFESVMPSNYLIFCHPLFLLSSIFSRIMVFPNELALHIRWPKYWSFSLNLSSEYLALISFRIDCFDLPALHKSFKGLLQHHSLKASIL